MTHLRILFIEDVEDHVLLIVRELQKGGLEIDFHRVETLQELEAALEAGGWDAIISDFNLPGFDGIDVLKMVQQKRLDLPFLLVSGAIGEEKAAEVMKAGAHDYIRKGNYARLVPTLERELRDAKLRHERRQTAEELTRHREQLEELVQERTAELRKSEQKFSKIFGAAPALIGIVSLEDGRIIDVNENALATLGYQREEVIGRTVAELEICAEPADCAAILLALGQGGAVRNREVRFKGKSAQYFIGMLSAEIIVLDDARYMLCLVGDITERKRAEEEIGRLNAALAARIAQLEETNQELEAFNRIVSHDLRQPLNTVALACQELELLYGDRLGADEIRSVKVALAGVQRMNGLIESLLRFARSSHGVVNCERVDLSSLGEGVIEQLKLGEPERRVSFRLQQGITIDGDPVLLRSVMDNLLGNAWKYTGMREEAIIEFGAMQIDGHEAYFVRDNGVGFEMADATRLFTPFERLDGGRQFEGFGIGLATVQRIILRHGGRIWAEGEPGRGATFYFTVNTSKTICGQ
jgi:PAS domain S-box-containing protein